MLAIVLAVLLAAFGVFMLTQQTTVPLARKDRGKPLPGVTTRTSDNGLGGGENGWVQSFDKKTGELTNEFRAEHFDPPVNNLMHVITAESRIYEHDGRVVRLQAVTGDITLAEGVKKGQGLNAMSSQPPSHGILYDVTLSLLETPEATVPVLVARVPVVKFDNDTLRLNTIDTTIDGKPVPADRVPVTVRGRDYDFDGWGLTVRYNQRDRRLESLHIDHGKRLLIKNPKQFGGMPTPGAAVATATPQPLTVNGVPIQLASADPQAVDKSVAAGMTDAQREQHRKKRADAEQRAANGKKPKKKKPATKPVATKPAATRPVHETVAYQADFLDDVRIREGDAPVGRADRMLATFTFEQDAKSATQPATQPAARSVGVPAGPRPVRPAVQAAADVRPSSAPARRRRPAAASETPSTQPAQPIEITWTGPLTVTPEKLATSGLRSTADRIVEFWGKPAHLARQGSTVDAAYVFAAAVGNRFSAAPDALTPVTTLHDAHGTVLNTRTIVADGDMATLAGDSSATMATNDQASSRPLVTTWHKTAVLHLVHATQQIQSATLTGDVDVRHPQLRMKSEELTLKFTPTAAKPPQSTTLPATTQGRQQPGLTGVHATGGVTATVTGDDGAVQTIASRTLDLATAELAGGKIGLKSLHAVGDVVAQDERQVLRTDDLATTLTDAAVDQNGTPAAGPATRSARRPATRPAATRPAATGPATSRSATTRPKSGIGGTSGGTFAIDTLVADGHVRYGPAAGVTGTSAESDRLTITREAGAQWLTLTGSPARVADARSAVTGDTIRVDTAGTHATIPGPGSLTGSNAGPTTQRAAATRPATAHPIRVVWNGSMTYDGQANRAKMLGGVVVHTVGSDGAVNTASGKTLDVAFADAAAARPSTKPAQAGFDGLGGGNKQVQALTLAGDEVEVKSQLHDPQDAMRLLRQTFLYTTTLTVHTNPDGSPGAMDVPVPGQILYTDVTSRIGPAATQTVTTMPATTQAAGGHGIVALQWAKRMTYDPATQLATLDGDVVVTDRPPGQDEMQMYAPRVVAEVSAEKDAKDQQVKRVRADQGATLKNKQVQIVAPYAEFDPTADRVIATGTPRQPVQLYDVAGGMSRGSIGKLWWNMKTNQPELMEDVTAEVNPVPKPDQNP